MQELTNLLKYKSDVMNVIYNDLQSLPTKAFFVEPFPQVQANTSQIDPLW